ncbi:hypothetical protein [Lacticaseibacillus thailandensis]|uniref:Uncharacterized protein n=1 Tax=Lacticaseibacillus thailandensis DSM 22698 = JCM 13996 TaxID=1423810 RepID=A0A0R2CF60_9LACO|nr:hypothetical protein [Lacticaseibacillus thailandensis]KRM87065.1 hypothetical protein FD19_GL001215 [Lacticaseibacillus thailandensis DSM 22698 = JCM 13996]
MWIWLFNFFFHNMLFREIIIVVLMVWVLFRFYHEYMRAANSHSDRIRRFGTRNIVIFTRKVLVTLLLVLVLVLAYDRVLPHWGIGAEQALAARKADRANSQSQAASLQRVSRSSSKATSSKRVSSKVSHSSQTKQSSHKSKTRRSRKQVAKRSSSSQNLNRGSKQTAVAIVQRYFKKHPDEKSSDIDTFKYAGKTTAYERVAYQVGGYAKGNTKMLHLFYVYKDGRIATVY